MRMRHRFLGSGVTVSGIGHAHECAKTVGCVHAFSGAVAIDAWDRSLRARTGFGRFRTKKQQLGTGFWQRKPAAEPGNGYGDG